MPENANLHVRPAKKRKTKETASPKDGCDSSFVSAYRDSSDEMQWKQSHGHHNFKKKIVQEAIRAPPLHPAEGFSLKSPVDKSLKEHMESILTEVKEAREKLFHWWRQEIQIIVATADQRRIRDTDAGKRQEQAEYIVPRDHASAQASPKEGQTCEKNSQVPRKLEPGKAETAAEAHKGFALDRSSLDKSCELSSPDPKPTVVDVAIDSGLGATSKTLKEPDEGLQRDKNEKAGWKMDVPAHNAMTKLPLESKNALFDMCFGAELGDDVKDVEGLDGTLESGVTMREGFEFNKASNDIQKGLDRLDRLRETKSALLDMGFDDDESNEGNGVGCSLESAASSKVNSGFSKANIGIQSSFNKGSDAGIRARCGEQSKEHLDSNGGLEGAASSAGIYEATKVKEEVILEEGKQAVVKEGVVHGTRRGRLDDEGRQVDCAMGAKLGQASIKGSYIVGGPLAQISEPKDVQQQLGMGTRSGCGIKRSYGTAMTFKGSALECRNDVFQQGNSYADVFNSATPSIFALKDSVQPPAGDKGKVESLSLHNPCNTLGIPGAASVGSSWNTFTTSKNAVNVTLQDSKIANLEYASRSKLGDAILGSGRTVDFPGFDPVPSYASHFKAGTEMMDMYQQERANTSSLYFSSLCTNNSVYLPPSNRLISLQRSPPSSSPSSGPGSRSMLMGMPGHVGGHHDPSNMHTFLGLGVNGVPAVASGMQGFPALYLQNNQQHNQTPFKSTPQSTSPMVSTQQSSAVQEKAILELNF